MTSRESGRHTAKVSHGYAPSTRRHANGRGIGIAELRGRMLVPVFAAALPLACDEDESGTLTPNVVLIVADTVPPDHMGTYAAAGWVRDP